MARKITIQNYQDMAAKKGLKYLGEMIPDSISVPTNWQCLRCGKIMTKTFQSVRAHNGCRCPSSKYVLDATKYEALAERLGITWLRGEFLPYNAHVPQQWRNKEGEEFTASYFEMGYDRMSNRIKKLLGLPYLPKGGRVRKPKYIIEETEIV